MLNRINNFQVRNNNENKKQSFKGAQTALLTGLRGLNNSPALGACGVDLCSMVIPRTLIETKSRGVQSGIETGFREGSSCILHASLGLIGLAAATLISGVFNKEHGIKAQNIFANADTINNMASIWKNSNGQSKQFFEGFVNNIKGLSGNNWNGVSQVAKDEIVDNLITLADKSNQLENLHGIDKANLKNEVKQLKDLIVAKVTKDTGANASFKLSATEGTKEISTSLSELVDNAVVLSNTFKTKTQDKLPSFVKDLVKNKTASTVLGMGVCAALCMSIQPLNRYLTKKRTGQDGFVGVDDNKQGDKSNKFKIAKTVAGIGFPALAIKCIGKPSELVSNIQFNSKIPTINQFKFVYSLTIGSRFLSSRDGNELRESVIKDTLGYTNWLILGGMVAKLTALGLGGKDLINNPVAQDGSKKGVKYAAKWLTKASVKSFDEVLLPNAKEIAKDGKLMKFSEIFKNADSATKSKVLKIATSQIAGYLYSGLVLGVGISKLNIFITKQLQAKKKANNQMNEKIAENSDNKYDIDYLEKMQSQMSSVFKEFN